MNNEAVQMFKSTVLLTEESLIPVLPICEFFGITYKWQSEKIKSDPIMKFEWKKTSSQKLFGDKRSRMCLSKKGFIRWVQLLSPDLVREPLREKFIEFQRYVFDFLFGSYQNHEDMSVTYTRLKKLRRLYGKIGAEIQICERKVKSYLDNTFQLSLGFSKSDTRE